MDVGYVPSNPNPLNIEIGPAGGAHRVTEDNDDALGRVQINDNLNIPNSSTANNNSSMGIVASSNDTNAAFQHIIVDLQSPTSIHDSTLQTNLPPQSQSSSVTQGSSSLPPRH